MMSNYIGHGTVFYPENLRGIVSDDDLKVPYSELAMHVGAAGRPLLAFGCKSRWGCGIIWAKKDGSCGFTTGLPGEVMHEPVRKFVGEVIGVGLSGIRRRRGRK